MYLKRLDLQGFKSFPEKVRLNFNKGITVVVGPNGSGKSNISDSVRWVLGEQKAKVLRGDKMEDIIFAGTETRKPIGFAEVSVTIDNSESKMPIEYTEVTVTRRVFRSGESEYLINGSICRLKDVHELFMDTGIGREGYSIIGQGKIDEILNSKSDDRRKLFEEAVGIVKFKNRRQETFFKLEKEQQNLARLEDIIFELENRIEPLEIQSKTAKEYINLKEKIKYCDIDIFKYKKNNIVNEINAIEEKLKIYYDDININEREIESINSKILLYKNDFNSYVDKIQIINNDISSKKSIIEKLESNIKVLEQKISNYLSNIDKIDSNKIKIYRSIEKNKNDIDIEISKIASFDITIKSNEQALHEFEEEFNRLNNILNKNENFINKYKSDIIEKMRLITKLNGEIYGLEGTKKQYNKRKTQIDSEKSYIESQINNNKIHIEALNKKIRINNDYELDFKSDLDNLEIKKNNIIEKSNNLKSILIKKEIEFNKKNSRISILIDMENDYDGFYKSVKYILKLSNKNDKRFNGIKGAVGKIFNVDKEYETAVEIALGSNVQNIVTDTEESAKILIKYLKQNNLGRATFLPITSIKGKSISNEYKNKILSEFGILGIASDIIKCDNIYKNIAIFLLGRVVIAKDINTAINFSKKYNYAYKIVTLEGDVVNSGGAITGGSFSKKTVGIFGRSREINEIQNDIDILQSEISKIKYDITNKNNEFELINNHISDINIKIKEIQIKNEGFYNDIVRTKDDTSNKSKKLDSYLLEENQLIEQLSIIDNDLFLVRQKYSSLNDEVDTINENLSKYQYDIENEKVSKEKLLNEITNAKINISNMKQNKKNSEYNINRIKDIINEFEKDIILSEKDRQNYNLDIENSNLDINNFKCSIDFCNKELLKLIDNLNISINERNKLNDSINNFEKKLKDNYEYISKIKNDAFKMEIKREKLNENIKNIIISIENEYDINISDIDYSIDNLRPIEIIKEEFDILKNRIKNLGNVNISAIDEYKEVKKRYDFLVLQKKDIIDAEHKLKNIISELTSLMEKQFKEQFEIVSNNFNETFREMFGGGMAYLKLSDENDILNSNIDIIAKPPGKNLQNMMLLSGGERALTAISILFSILKMKPSPFCILDEIEAALDDSNVKRYASYLKKFSNETQFIVITHRKGTMEIADVLYGITMQEKGISKLVSVDFTDKQYDIMEEK